jgi:hypothetical protein
VSLLERLGRGHLTDRQVADLWSASEAATASHPHLDACAQCRARYAEFDGWAADLADELRGEADEAFTAERLSVQQAQIARRLEALERPARVIAFPKAARAVISGHSHVRRWVTVAAAASLITGFGLGQVLPLRNALDRSKPQVAMAIPTQLTNSEAKQRAEELTTESALLHEEELLSGALSRPRVGTLTALDDMTPHARDIAPAARPK